jgi:ATP-dependent DNA helicase DinG
MKFAVLDFETTGSQPTDEIIQVGLVVIDELQITDRYTSLVKPAAGIPAFISGLTGIDDETVKDAPELEEVMVGLQKRLVDCILVGHNIAFDLAFLQRALDYCGYSPFSGQVLDTMDLLRIVYPALPSLQLSMVSQSLGVTHERPHQADSDAEATAEIWLQLMQRFSGLPLLTVQRVAHIFVEDGTDFSWFLQVMRERKEQMVALDLENNRYFRQFALQVDDWGEEEEIRTEEEVKEQLHVPFEQFYGQFKQELQQRFAVFEDREAQETMISEVAMALTEDRHLMIEAGTGTGKSLGYLVPSLFYGIHHNEKVVVSTHTINLQEQLRQRDIPLLHSIFPVPFRAAVLKGRSHYLCLRKFEHKINNSDYESVKEERMTAAQMVVWLSETLHGDEEEIHFAGRGHEFWQTVASDTDSCLNRACPWFKKCFYHRARNEANIADVVITNHSLLFTDIKAENRLLPAYKHLVIDEAHHFEEVASKHLGIEVHYMAFLNSLMWLYKDSKSGQLPMLRQRLARAEGELAEKAADWCRIIDDLYLQMISVKENWDELVGLLYELITGRHDSSGEVGQLVLRIKSEFLPSQWNQLLTIEENIFVVLSDALRQIDKLMQALKDSDEFDMQSAITDISGTVKDLYRHRDSLHFFMKRTDPDYVYWMEASSYFKAKSLQLISVPMDVSPMLKQHFFEVKDSVIMTSATLSVDKKFHYTCEQLGLDADGNSDKFRTVLLPSPFNYRKQALVCIPRDFPGVKGAGGEAFFIDHLIQSLKEVAIETKGRMLVLFTSHRMLKLVHQGLKEPLQQEGIHVLGQGVDTGNRSKLTRMFQDSVSCVLLGTSSFWEGVDIPGKALSCLAIVRLPFQPPSHPIVEAKSENLIKNKQNPFMKFSVPQAVIRFKQGFGRLVRTAQDKGIVIIYDTRVIDTQYGKYFLYSLPGPKIEHMNTNQLVPRIKDWMKEDEG